VRAGSIFTTSAAEDKDIGGIARRMLADLIAQELVDRGDRLRIGRHDPYAPAVRRGFAGVRDETPPLPHDSGARRQLAVRRERFAEIAGGERGRDLPEVRANPRAAIVVRGVPDGDLDRASIRREQEMVHGRVLIEPHGRGATAAQVFLVAHARRHLVRRLRDHP
jgi:hypothetical protein